jgi:lysophospholipase L1-like esterase
MKKWIFISLLVFVVIFLFFYFSKSNKDIRNYPSDGTTIVVFGDSLVEGVGASTKGGFVELLSKKTSLPVVNLGVSGNTTADGLKRVNEIFEHDPKVVVLLLGGNDYLKKVPREETFKNLSEIINKIHEKGAVVLLLGVRGGVLKDNFEDSFKDLVSMKKVAYVPDVLDGIVFDRALMSDAIHPNQKGYELIAQKVSPTLESLLK